MGSTGDAYLRKLLLVRTRLRQPQDRRYAIRRGRRVARNGFAVTDRIQNSGKTLLNRSVVRSRCFSFVFSFCRHYRRSVRSVLTAAQSFRKRRNDGNDFVEFSLRISGSRLLSNFRNAREFSKTAVSFGRASKNDEFRIIHLYSATVRTDDILSGHQHCFTSDALRIWDFLEIVSKRI